MPIFQDDLGGRTPPPRKFIVSGRLNSPVDGNVVTRKLSEESIRTDLCEGPVTESSGDSKASQFRGTGADSQSPEPPTADRTELIQRLKKGQSGTWVIARNLESMLPEYQQAPQTPARTSNTPVLLPSPELSETDTTVAQDLDRSQAGLQIERPRSALHSGDFTQPSAQNDGGRCNSPHLGLRSTSYAAESSWLATSPPRDFSPFHHEAQYTPGNRLDASGSFRSRAPSLSSSLSSSFVMKPPTSPLVQSESNDDLDFASHITSIDIASGFNRNARRHTFQVPNSMHSNPFAPTPSPVSRPLPHLRRDNTYPYQAHQPRRSLTSNSLSQPTSSCHTPDFLRSRRPSYSDGSPLHASMVGSYEESILRGRMSTTPSKPLDFVAQIGVLGLGKCKSNLRCPAHVTIPFPAVFYSYETTSHGRAGKGEDGPSPYVGLIDIENSLPNQEISRDSKRKRHSTGIGRPHADDISMEEGLNSSHITVGEVRRVEKQKRRSTSPRAPPGGSYRIPEKGQLQIIIKNPNKTAVKLFLVPYDLTGMEPGMKTFIRQRSYSAGPIVDSPLASTPHIGNPNPLDRPTLRYLVHLHICSPSRGRFYLYKSIRVVFANRVPDGKEKLRNEISLPEPRFSVYKPGRDSINGGGPANSGAGANLVAEKAYRRRSSGFPLSHPSHGYDVMDGITQALEKGFGDSSAFSSARASSAMPVQAIPFSFARKPITIGEDSGLERPSNVQSPTSSKSSRPPTSPRSGMSMSWDSSSTGLGGYDKLHRGDAGYGGNIFALPSEGNGAAEGLLAKKLRDLDVLQSHHYHPDNV